MAQIIIGHNTTGGSGANTAGLEDTYINVQSPTTNFGTAVNINLREGGTQQRRALIRPTDAVLATLAGATVTAALLRFYAISSSAGRIWTAYEQLRAWTVAGVTWNTYDGTNSWGTAGGIGAGDSEATASGTGTTVAAPGQFDLTFDETGIADLQAMVNAGTGKGWIIQTNFDSSQDHESSEGTDGSRVELIVTYTAGGGSGLLLPIHMQYPNVLLRM